MAERWRTVAGAALAQTVGMGPLLQFTFPVFLLPLAAEFSADRGQVSLALTSALLATAVTVPIAGRLYDRLNMARVATLAVLILAGALLLLSQVARSLVGFTVIFTLVGMAAAFHTPLPYTRAVTLRFDRNRGLALGLALTGVGIGTILVPQIASGLIVAEGWRAGYAGLALLLVLIALPGILLCMRGLPAATGHAPAVASGWSRGEALREARFWRLLGGLFLAALAANGTLAHLIPLARDAGLDPAAAVRLLSLAGISSIAGRLLAGRLADRVWAPAVAAVFFVFAALGVGVLLIAEGTATPWLVAATLIGLGLGAEADLMALLVSRYYGPRAFGEIFGVVFATFLLASSLGPLLMGLTFAQAGSYHPALVSLLVCLIAAAALFLGLGPYRYAPANEGAE